MAVNKALVFGDQDQQIAQFAKGLAHPARITILRYLAQRSTCVCGDIVDELPLSQSTVSQHLKALKQCGLIQGNIDGPRVCYCIDPENFRKARELLGSFFDHAIQEYNCHC